MILTHHALERGKKRVGLDPRTFQKMAEKAWEKGHSQGDFKKGKMQDYLYALWKYNHSAGAVKIYAQYAFVFTMEGILITVLHIPATHRNYKPYLKKDATECLLQTPTGE